MQMRTLVMIGGLAFVAGTGAIAQTQSDQSRSKSAKPADTITVHG
jgi:hypothetical protein